MKTNCSAPPSLPPKANAAELRELGHTAESEMQPTPYELKFELKMKRMSVDEYKAECERYGYQMKEPITIEAAYQIFRERYPDAAWTIGLSEHPQDHNGPCMCAECLSYAD